MNDKAEALDRLIEIKDELSDLLGEAQQILSRDFPSTAERAEMYWIAHIEEALGDRKSYGMTFDSTLEEIERQTYGEE